MSLVLIDGNSIVNERNKSRDKRMVTAGVHSSSAFLVSMEVRCQYLLLGFPTLPLCSTPPTLACICVHMLPQEAMIRAEQEQKRLLQARKVSPICLGVLVGFSLD